MKTQTRESLDKFDPSIPAGSRPQSSASTPGKQKMRELWNDRATTGSAESRKEVLDADKFD